MTESTHQEQGALFSFVTTLVVFGLISACIYYLLLKPILNIGDRPREHHNININRTAFPPDREAARRQRVQNQRQQPRAAVRQSQEDSDSIFSLLSNDKFPSHVNPNSFPQAGLGGMGLLVDGLVPFRHGRAANYTTDKDVVATDRRERARVMARLLALGDGTPSPPARGSTIVVSLQHEGVDCSKLRRVLFLLGTYYNLMVVMSFGVDSNASASQEKQNKNDADLLRETINKLRGDSSDAENYLPSEVLPDHRVVASRTVTGRVAFVRQLARVEVVLDFDPEIKTQLGRFGFHVYIYKQDTGGSGLGTTLMP